MCRVSDKLKLCTCKTPLSKLKHYWVLHRFAKHKNVGAVIGEAILPYDLSVEDEQFNRETLLRLLNDGNVFDVNLEPSNKDRLQLTFTVKNSGELRGERPQIDYGFEYRNKRWNLIEYDVFEWLLHHEEERYGKIKNALQ